MGIIELLFSVLMQFWFVIPFLLIISIFKSRWLKGIFGEFLVNRLLSQLPEKHYTLIKNLTLPTQGGTTQVDHIVVSNFGIFVLETKNMKGWIFGDVYHRQWTQRIFHHTSKFQNPLHQNYKHVKTIESLLGINPQYIHSVIVFVGDSRFKTDMPENVTYGRACLQFIRKFNEPVISDSERDLLIEKLNAVRLKSGIATHIQHQKHVEELITTKVAERACSRCGAEMVLRETKRGSNVGKRFWGCSTFPRCRSVEELEQ